MPPHVLQVEVALLERLFDRSPDVVFFVKDAGGRYVAANESLDALAEHRLRIGVILFDGRAGRGCRL